MHTHTHTFTGAFAGCCAGAAAKGGRDAGENSQKSALPCTCDAEVAHRALFRNLWNLCLVPTALALLVRLDNTRNLSWR